MLYICSDIDCFKQIVKNRYSNDNKNNNDDRLEDFNFIIITILIICFSFNICYKWYKNLNQRGTIFCNFISLITGNFINLITGKQDIWFQYFTITILIWFLLI